MKQSGSSGAPALDRPPPHVANALSLTEDEAEKLSAYVALLRRWQAAINLISGKTLIDIWDRHILDCGQLREHVPDGSTAIADIGSGAGLPGIILSIMGIGPITLIESDNRKAAFLQTVIGELGLTASVAPVRAETMPEEQFDLIAARAVAPLDGLIQLTAPLLKTGGKLLILKGKTHQEELTAAGKNWTIDAQTFSSRTDPAARILLIENIRPNDERIAP
ncbi:MAG: 16S rRNA (guanine(527)-N(7))-methyltransferase RsmG [Rhodospirillaceae bacterium]